MSAGQPSVGRYRKRLEALPVAALLDIAAVACETSAAARKKSDELLALHSPTPAWAVSKVLLSPELLHVIMATLDLSDHAVAAVCPAWKRAWADMIDCRRVLRPAAAHTGILGAAHALNLKHGIISLVALPGDERLCIVTQYEVRIVSKALKTLKTLPGEGLGLPSDLDMWGGAACAGDAGLYLLGHSMGNLQTTRIYRLDLESCDVVASSSLHGAGYELNCGSRCMALSADGGHPRLFVSSASGFNDTVKDQSLLVLDAISLELLSAHHGRELFRGACSPQMPDEQRHVFLDAIAVSGEELLIVDGFCGRVCVYASRTLEPRRVIFSNLEAHLSPTGLHRYNTPVAMLLHKERLFITEYTGEDIGFDDDDECPEDVAYQRWVSGKRVVVLTLDGQVLREYVSPNAWPWCERVPGVECETLRRWRDGNLPKHQCFWASMCVFDGQLILGDGYEDGLSALTALQGV